MRIGMICPYSFDVAGGVQAHVVDLARVLIERGHEVSVLTPSSKETVLPDFAVSSGKAVAIPYNGSVSRLSFGPKAFGRLRKWIRKGEFDVLHVHEPNAPSLGMLALAIADGPIVATFHTSTEKSLVLSVFQSVLRPSHEKIRGKIAVSELARRWQMESLGSDAIEIPNGVDVRAFADGDRLPGYPRPGKTVLFLGRYDEPRKGMAVFLEALPAIVAAQPDIEVLVIGRGDEEKLLREAGPYAKHLRLMGAVTDEEKAAALRSADIYVAPNLGGESFGIVLVEAMAAGTAVVASDLNAFERVLDGGEAGRLFPVGDGASLGRAIVELLDDDFRRAELVTHASEVVWRFDWSVVAEQVIRVYETVAVPGVVVSIDD
ncbi:GDP-mannose-dependent alpha-(1-2)-phosphatidylinositol mannosyltransferase (plasmid) [Tsukamurella tyrosinosolvens]|uniref:Phosphatidylinositol alpha-mannosyltransferase n=1 Tax=Tsukamurella tyrosinosolvens TaxID=57704 RepID=A0A1H4SPP2_TSUTY|nr:glycosyltransferase family 4 protein [Tsukamurella tyrosinosolvens]KXO93416.1 alpha-(1-2)-phosphatidylinositol mannosyltransferase [Tsukamurella tyrosinosolvens]SEC45811.1 Phosphatidylinositol alpha-mannosyltransferase [Tsukamurella tyrosinosolvens]VEH98903.1 GDP-mannose-dependent alpha-(1-2)-phosphatidylinositol mannosyltransferase [Tsukamurella tyrosinosolvens]